MRLLAATLLTAVLLAAPGAAAEGPPAPLTDRHPAAGGAVTRVFLPGGPTVLLQPEEGSPAVSVALALPSGSRREPSDRTGLAHLLEHLVFRATPHYSAGRLPLELEAVGARTGARTTPGETVFWETVPASQVELALRIEADRLDGLTFSTRDLERERELLLAELEGLEGRPAFRVEADLRRALWPREPEGNHLPAGDPAELRQATADDLRALYEKTYRREHAVISVVGGFQAEEVLRTLEDLFPEPAQGEGGSGPPVPEPSPVDRRAEPGRSSAGEEPGLLMMAFPAPSPGGADYLPYAVLDAALTEGGTARLAQALKGSGRLVPDPDLEDGFHRITVYLAEGADPKQVEARLRQELESLRTRELTLEELQSASRRARARFFRAWQGPALRARALAQAEALGRLDALLEFPDRVPLLKPVQVREAASRVLDPGRVKVYLPPAGSPAGEARPDPGAGAAEAEGQPAPPTRVQPLAQAAPASLFQRRRLENGATVLVWRDPRLPVVSLRGYLSGGALLDPLDREGLTALSARLLGRGTVSRPQETFLWDLEDRGMRLRFRGDRQLIFVEGWCLKEDLPRFCELLADALRNPQPAAEAVVEARNEAREAARQAEASLAGRAEMEFLARIYPPGHPYSRPSGGTESSIQSASVDQVRAHLAQVSRPDLLTLCFVGDVTEAQVMDALRPDLTSWFAEGHAPRAQAPDAPAPEAARKDLEGRGPWALVLAGHPGPSRRDPDWYAFNVLSQILGGNPATSRLALRIRDEEKLGPSASARLVPLSGPAPWAVVLRVRPDQVDRALEVVRAEMERLRKEPPSEAEVKRAVAALEGRLDVALADLPARAELLATLQYYHLSDSYPRGFSGLYSGITPKQILQTAQDRLRPEGLVVVVALPPETAPSSTAPGEADPAEAAPGGEDPVEDAPPEDVSPLSDPAPGGPPPEPERVDVKGGGKESPLDPGKSEPGE